MRRCTGAVLSCLALAGCGGGGSSSAPPGHITVRSPAFASGQPIPAAYTCAGKDISPPLRWSGLPKEAERLRLTMNDLTAHFVHWTVSGIDPRAGQVAAGAVPEGGRQGTNSFGRAKYGGPCPPAGDAPHRYRFTVSALGANGETLDRGSLVGTFARRPA